MTADTARRPLAGLRVLDLSNLLAAPMATMYLADFGADVIKVEHPKYGDELRRWGASKDGVALFFKMLNRNKRLVTLDLKQSEGQELCRKMVSQVDVVVENYRPGTLERWGLGWADLRAVNERLIMARVTGFGQTGPYSHRPGFGTIAEAFAGYAAMCGHSDRPPLLPPFGLGDASTAIHTAYGIMLALYERDRSGQGQVIDVGLYEGLFTLLGSHVVDYDQLGIVPERQGSRLAFVAPRNVYQTADGAWMAIAGATQGTFERIVTALGLAHLIDDPDFADNRARLRNVDRLDVEIQRAVAQFTLTELEAIFGDAAAPIGPVNTIAQMFTDPHYAARGNIASVPDEQLGVIRMQSPVPRLSETPGTITHAAREKGADNDEVYRSMCGCDAHQLAHLAERHVI